MYNFTVVYLLFLVCKTLKSVGAEKHAQEEEDGGYTYEARNNSNCWDNVVENKMHGGLIVDSKIGNVMT